MSHQDALNDDGSPGDVHIRPLQRKVFFRPSPRQQAELEYQNASLITESAFRPDDCTPFEISDSFASRMEFQKSDTTPLRPIYKPGAFRPDSRYQMTYAKSSPAKTSAVKN
jgi:hypothetical protein